MNKGAFCELVDLKGVKKRKTDGYLIKEAEEAYIKKTLEKGCACVAAGDNGSMNIWKTDAGVIRGEVMRNWHTLEERSFSDYSEVAEWAAKWIDYITCIIPLPTAENPNYAPEYNPAFKRDIERVIVKSRENAINAFCEANCGNWENYDGNGNACARNCCKKFILFTDLLRMKPIRGLETEEAKDAVIRHIEETPEKS